MAVNLSPVGGVAAQFFDNNGVPLAGGKLYTYAAGTTTPATAYTSSQGVTAWSNPIILNSAGRVSGSGEIWITDGILYKFVLETSTGVLIATYDNISGINSSFVAFTNQQEIVTATAGQTVFNLGISYQPATNSLSVFVDGVNQYGPGAQYAYTETDSDTVTFTSGLHVGAEVKFTTTQQQGAGAVDASQVTYDPPFTGSVATNVEAKLEQSVSVYDFYDATTADPWADAFEAAANSFGAGVAGQVIVPPGQYQMERTVTTPGFIHWIGDGAELYANVNSQIFFTGFPVYFTCFQGFSFFGNGYTGVQAFNLTSWRLASSITNCTGTDLEYFAYLGEGCFGSLIANCATLRVPFPVRIGQNNSAFHILSCQFDNGATVAGTGVGIGVEIATGGIVSVGVKITSGYIQGFDHGVIDGAVGTTIDTVYFETNVVADILGSNALFGAYNSCNHPAVAPGCVAYELDNCQNVTIYNPIVPSGGRDFVFDVDVSNVNCTIYMPGNDISWNFPTGDLQYLGRIQSEQRGTATPIVIGASTAGTATYSTQALSWRKTAYGAHVEISLAWTGHTGTGPMVVTGIPNDMQPSTALPLRFGQVVASGFAIAAGQIYAYFNGTGSQLSFGYVDTSGVITLLSVPAAGELNIVLDYDR